MYEISDALMYHRDSPNPALRPCIPLHLQNIAPCHTFLSLDIILIAGSLWLTSATYYSYHFYHEGEYRGNRVMHMRV